MVFNTFLTTVKKYPDHLAINNITYKELHDLVVAREYTSVSKETDWTIMLDILKAACVNKPIVILPKFHRDDVEIPKVLPKEFGIILFSSGTSGTRKTVFMHETMILENAINAIDAQKITADDKILTVCSLNHTGGISAQTLPGLLRGAHVIVEQFNAFNLLRLIKENNITLTHLVPVMIDALIKVNSKLDVPTLRLVVAGSDCVYRQHVEFWTNRGKQFMVNYGLSEAGPIIINHIFSPGDDMSIHDVGVVIGSKAWCEVDIENNELFLRGLCVHKLKDWFATGDCVEKHGDWFIYRGRLAAGCKILPKAY